MPINLNLLEDGHILWFQIEGTWKPEEIVSAKEKTSRIFHEATHPIQALVDFQHASVNLALITASQQVIGGDPLPNAGRIAVIGVPKLMRMVVEPILKVANSGDPIAFFSTFDEAKAYLKQFITTP